MIQVIVAAIGGVAAIAAAWLAGGARKQARGANTAVNAVGEGEPTLKERVARSEAKIELTRLELQEGLGRIDDHVERLSDGHAAIQREIGRLSGLVEPLVKQRYEVG